MSRTTPDLNALNARVRRRELRTSRGGLSVFVAVILMILAGYAALEAGARAVDHEAWLLAPELPRSSPVYSMGLCNVRNSMPSSLACLSSSIRAGISSSLRR